MSPGSDRREDYKVPRVAHEHDMEEMLDEMERRWSREGSEGASLRTLARAFNLRLFRRVLARHDVSATEPEFETMYDILRGDEGTGADRNRVRRTLERAGIDIADLEEHFITHQAVHTYLTEGRGLSKVEREGRSPAKSRETIDRLRGRLTAVIESELRSLDNSPEFTFDDPDAIVTVTVNCKTCNAHMDLIEALASGGCDCA